MSSQISDGNLRPDQITANIAEYVCDYEISSKEAYRAARYCVMDALGCAVEALSFPECTKLLGPMVAGFKFPHGARVPGTQFELDPVNAAFNIGTMIRWLDFNDAFSGTIEGGHPSDNLGAILAVADHLSRTRMAAGGRPLVMRDVLTALIKAYEIQGMLSFENHFTGLGFDYVTLPRVAATAVVTQMLGGGRKEIISGVSNGWADGVCIKVYRLGNTGARKGWAAGDAASRAVWLGLLAMKGEMGYPNALTAKTYGFYDALFRGKPFKVPSSYGTHVIENVSFKSVPAANQGQTAVECAFRLHPHVKGRLNEIAAITIRTQNILMRGMDKRGPLINPAYRDHCAQYVVAVALIHGKLNTSDFEDEFAADPRIDELREKTILIEEPRYSRDHLDPEKLSIANAVEIRFKDGTSTPVIEIEYPIGHPRRRKEGIPMLEEKFRNHIARHFPTKNQVAIFDTFLDQDRFEATPVSEFMDRFVIY